MVRLGIVGIGFMGMTHFKAAQGLTGGRVAAIVSSSERKRQGDWRAIQGNFGDSGGVQDLSDIKTYAELAPLLEDAEIDLVDLCVPTHLHAELALQALAAGKHVLVEKPLALTLADADAMLAAAEAADRRLFVAHVLRFFPEFAHLRAAVEDNRYGPLQALSLTRIISQPTWGGGWFSQVEKTGGPVLDLHIHDADFVRYLLGEPEAIAPTGLAHGEQVTYVDVHYRYGSDVAVRVAGGAVAAGSLPFQHGYDAFFAEATLQFNSSHTEQIVLYPAEGDATTVALPAGDPFREQLQYVVDALAGRQSGARLSGASARESLALCLRTRDRILGR